MKRKQSEYVTHHLSEIANFCLLNYLFCGFVVIFWIQWRTLAATWRAYIGVDL